MKPKWQKLASLAQEICTLYTSFSSSVQSLLPKNIFYVYGHAIQPLKTVIFFASKMTIPVYGCC